MDLFGLKAVSRSIQSMYFNYLYNEESTIITIVDLLTSTRKVRLDLKNGCCIPAPPA
jgi:hypothetical protein